jgi:hypothetical protein
MHVHTVAGLLPSSGSCAYCCSWCLGMRPRHGPASQPTDNSRNPTDNSPTQPPTQDILSDVRIARPSTPRAAALAYSAVAEPKNHRLYPKIHKSCTTKLHTYCSPFGIKIMRLSLTCSVHTLTSTTKRSTIYS